jgi:hypothetical protein
MGHKYGMEMLEVRVLYGNKIVYKDKCVLRDKKGSAKLFSTLSIKFDLGMEDMFKQPEHNWFNIH